MLNLIRLELKKVKIKRYVKSALIADAVMLGLLYLINFISAVEGEPEFMKFKDIFLDINTLTNVIFFVFAGVLIARLIVEEYKSKTVNILFTYPISRKKIILSKLLIVVLFTFSSIVLSSILLSFIFCITHMIHPLVSDKLTLDLILTQLISVINLAAFNSIISLIPLYFGFRKKSVPATIVSSIIIVLITNSNNNGFTLSSVLIAQIVFALLGVLSVYLTIKDIENKDILAS